MEIDLTYGHDGMPALANHVTYHLAATHTSRGESTASWPIGVPFLSSRSAQPYEFA